MACPSDAHQAIAEGLAALQGCDSQRAAELLRSASGALPEIPQEDRAAIARIFQAIDTFGIN